MNFLNTRGVLVLAFWLLLLQHHVQAQQNLVCPYNTSSSRSTRLRGYDPVRRFTEISGLVFSDQKYNDNPLLYVITYGLNNNTELADVSGGRIGVYRSASGRRLLTLILGNATTPNWDWESMTYGSCGASPNYTIANADKERPYPLSGNCLYVADVGDNVAIDTKGKRSDRFLPDRNFYLPYRIIKIKEPNYTFFGDALETLDNITVPDQDVSILPYTYYHESSPTDYADCEAIFIDHTGWGHDGNVGDIYLVTKWAKQHVYNTRLFKIPVGAWTTRNETALVESNSPLTIHDTIAPEVVSQYNREDTFFQIQWTGSDMRRDGTVIALSNPKNTSMILRCPGESVAEAMFLNAGDTSLDGKICGTFHNPAQGQNEASAFTPGMSRFLQIPEGPRPRMGWSHLVFNNPKSTRRTCPDYTEEVRKEETEEEATMALKENCTLTEPATDSSSATISVAITNESTDNSTAATTTPMPASSLTRRPTSTPTTTPATVTITRTINEP